MVLYCIIIIYVEITQDMSDGNAVQSVIDLSHRFLDWAYDGTVNTWLLFVSPFKIGTNKSDQLKHGTP